MNDLKSSYLSSFAPWVESGDLALDYDYWRLLQTIESRYPIVGSNIDWSGVPEAISAGEMGLKESRRKFQGWFGEIAERFSLVGPVCVVGDGPVEIGVVGSLDAIVQQLPLLASLPQHTYVFAYPDGDWCASLAFEGWMDFGYAVR